MFILRLQRSLWPVLAAFAIAPAARADTLTGRVVGPAGAGIAGVRVEPSHGASPVITDVNGFFTLILAPASYDLDFLPGSLPWAPRRIVGIFVAGTVNLGNVVLQPGFLLNGTLLGPGNVPVAGGNINVYDQATRVKLFTPGDGTNLVGWFEVTVPAGTYRVRLAPPPSALLVARELSGVVVSGTTPLGNIVLAAGYQVTGTVVSAQTLQPLANIDLDAEDALTGEEIITPNDDTNALGAFSLVLPRAVVHLSLAPPPGVAYSGLLLHNIFVLGPVNVGQIPLAPGLLLTCSVRGPGSVPVAGADLDVHASDGTPVYTPHDDTDGGGIATVVVPAGTFRLTVEPRVSDGLVGARTLPFTVSASTILPPVSLAAGVLLTGAITGPLGPEAGADIDVIDPVTGEELITPGDRTDASGMFAAVVPNGTWNVLIRTAEGSHGQPAIVAGVLVNGNTTLNRSLPSKSMRVTLDTFGIWVAPQGGMVPVFTTIHNLLPTSLPTLLELVVRYPSGVETPVLPQLPFNLVPLFPITLSLVWIPIPPVPASETGKVLDLLLRFRDPGSGAVFDSATAPFVVH